MEHAILIFNITCLSKTYFGNNVQNFINDIGIGYLNA